VRLITRNSSVVPSHHPRSVRQAWGEDNGADGSLVNRLNKLEIKSILTKRLKNLDGLITMQKES